MRRSDTDPNAVRAANPDLYSGCAVIYNVGPERYDACRASSGIVYQDVNGQFFCVWDCIGSVDRINAGDAAVMEVLEGDLGRYRDERRTALKAARTRDAGRKT